MFQYTFILSSFSRHLISPATHKHWRWLVTSRRSSGCGLGAEAVEAAPVPSRLTNNTGQQIVKGHPQHRLSLEAVQLLKLTSTTYLHSFRICKEAFPKQSDRKPYTGISMQFCSTIPRRQRAVPCSSYCNAWEFTVLLSSALSNHRIPIS